jgi:hypothetical protein
MEDALARWMGAELPAGTAIGITDLRRTSLGF